MSDDYGRWHQPAFGAMHTRPAPGMRADPSNWLPREGAGDWRKPVALLSGKGEARSVPADHRTDNNNVPRVYVARRNGLPEGHAYRWRQPRAGWAARMAARNLDPAAIAAADRELAGVSKKL